MLVVIWVFLDDDMSKKLNVCQPRFLIGQIDIIRTVGSMGVMICLSQRGLCSPSTLSSQ